MGSTGLPPRDIAQHSRTASPPLGTRGGHPARTGTSRSPAVIDGQQRKGQRRNVSVSVLR
eukprot:8752407-Pyramimonas_sp.AAC.1